MDRLEEIKKEEYTQNSYWMVHEIERLRKENEIMWNALDDIACGGHGTVEYEFAKETMDKVEALKEKL